MVSLVTLTWIFVNLFVAGSIQADPSLKCEADSNSGYKNTVFGSYYDRSIKYRCSYANVKSESDIIRARANALIFSPERVSTIVFVNSTISRLPDKMFSNFSTVKSLDASRTNLEVISTSAFFGLTLWDDIDLSKNAITRLDARTFAGMTVKLLDLSQNRIVDIDDKTFMNANIEKIILNFNQLKTIQFMNSFSYFNVVEMNNNKLESFKLEVKKDAFMTPRSLFSEQEFPKFYFQNNPIKKFDCFSTVRIDNVELRDNTEITEILLNECDIDEIDVSNCGNLKKMKLNDKLLGFTAKDMRLNDIDMSKSKSLISLSLVNSSLSQNVLDQVMSMENLTTLDLSYNNIGPLNISTFAKLKSLQFLVLKATNISNIQFGTFSHQHHVKKLDVSDNHLGYFDMNMIFSMSSLLVLDLSGNDLESLEKFESAHFTFTLLQQIDLSKNKFPCSYLLQLIKVFKLYKVTLIRSNIEEQGTNIHGISCIHNEGDDSIIEPLSPDSKNMTDIRDKMNEMIQVVAKNTQFQNSIESRIKQLESRIDNQLTSSSIQAALKSEKSQIVEVKNSTFLESTMTIVCLAVLVFLVLKIVTLIRTNFLNRPKQMRNMSQTHLAMTVDDF